MVIESRHLGSWWHFLPLCQLFRCHITYPASSTLLIWPRDFVPQYHHLRTVLCDIKCLLYQLLHDKPAKWKEQELSFSSSTYYYFTPESSETLPGPTAQGLCSWNSPRYTLYPTSTVTQLTILGSYGLNPSAQCPGEQPRQGG